MPGFARTQQESDYVVNSVDTYNFGNLFYGLTIDGETGRLEVTLIADDSDIIRLPSDVSDTSEDYREWVWSQRNLDFEWGATDTDHLLVRIN
jgi:hypothetical protein